MRLDLCTYSDYNRTGRYQLIIDCTCTRQRRSLSLFGLINQQYNAYKARELESARFQNDSDELHTRQECPQSQRTNQGPCRPKAVFFASQIEFTQIKVF